MITQKLIDIAQQQAYLDAENGAPSKFHIDYSVEIAKDLAMKLNASVEVVTLGCYLMDCKLGTALQEQKLSEHVQLSHQKAQEILNNSKEITEQEKNNVLHCILEHHKVETFYSLESEICCNADCYRFASVKGFIGGNLNSRVMPFDDVTRLYFDKADEKWSNITLDIVRKELEPQYRSIKELLSYVV